MGTASGCAANEVLSASHRVKMDKRIGWNLDTTEHATFNWIRPIPACAKVGSQVHPGPATRLDTAPPISGSILHMRVFKRRFVFWIGVALFILFWATVLGPEPPARIPISPGELVRAVTLRRDSLIELCLIDHVDPNGRDDRGRTPLLIATAQQDWKTAQRLLSAGALVDLADNNGFTPLMAAAVHGNLEMFRELLARSAHLHAEDLCKDGNDLLGMALDGGNPNIVKSVLELWPALPQWRTSTRRTLQAALTTGNKSEIQLLLSKHSAPPTPEGKDVPLLAYAIARNDSSLFGTLLACGADPNTALPSRCDKEFLAALPSKAFGSYIEGDKGLTVLMLAAGLDREDYLRALLAAGANR
ncbi:MAG: hypothetical protein DME65_04070, partial [Verrucomicrobia bacterium]